MIRVQDIPRDERAPAVARQLLIELEPQLPAAVVADARLLVSEVVSNSVRHGAGRQVRVLLETGHAGGLRCEVMDAGDAFVPRARARAATDVGGWGLRLVEELSACWGVRQGSTHVWFELIPGAE